MEKGKPFHREDVDGNLRLVLSNGLYIDSLNLKAGIQNQIRRLAAIRNPAFYKNAAIGMSNFAHISVDISWKGSLERIY